MRKFVCLFAALFLLVSIQSAEACLFKHKEGKEGRRQRTKGKVCKVEKTTTKQTETKSKTKVCGPDGCRLK